MKIWGVRSGLIGDTIMVLPSLTYFKKKYGEFYIHWVIDKKCSQAAPLYINHPLIDNIKITDKWCSFGENDKRIIKDCDIIIDVSPQNTEQFWYNKMDCVEQAMRMAGLTDYKDILTEDDMYPKLNKWFVDPSTISDKNHGYTQSQSVNDKIGFKVGIFPFAHYGSIPHRSPSLNWWNALCYKLYSIDCKINHFGWISEPNIDYSINYTKYSFFEQIKMALECDIVIGTDSGSMWVIGAYSHPSIHIMTYHMAGHNDNPDALVPYNKNGITFFNPNSCDLNKINDIVESVEYEKNKLNR